MSAEPVTADDRFALYDEAMTLLSRANCLLIRARKAHELALFQAQTNKETIEQMTACNHDLLSLTNTMERNALHDSVRCTVCSHMWTHV
jgi:hypothetical protein